MDPIYPRFATADPFFYDDPRRRVRPAEGGLAPAADRDWSEWAHLDDGHWSSWHPAGARLPDQGWKVHVTTTPEGSRGMLETVSRFCHERRLSFKHLSHLEVLLGANGKEGDRTASGKFVTVYPADEASLHDTLVGLDGLVGGRPGPYVLSDLRWNVGPLSVRYGAFERLVADVDGRRVAAVRAPDRTLVEDVRTVAFVVPDWVGIPPFLDAQRPSPDDRTPPAGLPRVVRALHHSNAGGVYEAVDHDGARVVLKEARPHAGLTPDGRDAVTRVRDEGAVLARIASPRVVRMRRTVEAHGHVFLVLDHVEAVPLHTAVVQRHPLVRAGSTRADRRAYRDWALAVADRVADAVRAVHRSGHSHGDLHPGNVLVDADDEVVLIDLEMARPLDRETPPVIGAPGFVPRDGRGGARLDAYALACIRLFVFAPFTPLIALDPRSLHDLVAWAGERFELDATWAADLVAQFDLAPAGGTVLARADAVLTAWQHRGTADLDPVIAAIGDELVASADLSRTDRAWPGDPAQFAEPPASLAHGAGGVLVALTQAGVEVPAAATEWFRAACARELAAADPRPGLYDGLAGIAWAQRRLGLHAEADRTVARLRSVDVGALGPDLASGMSGIGLVLLDESAADAALLPRARMLAEHVREGFDARTLPHPSRVATDRGGLLRGASGVALFAGRLFAATGEAQWLDLAERAVDADLAACVRAADGSLQVDEGWRAVPYLGSGSAGIGWAIAGILAHTRHRARYEDALAGILRAASTDLVVNCGLLQGRAGLVHVLLALGRLGLTTPDSDLALAHHVRALSLHAIRRPDGLAFPGHGLLRLSCDLATGASGVLSALTAYRDLLDGRRPQQAVPFLDPPSDPRSPVLAARAEMARR